MVENSDVIKFLVSVLVLLGGLIALFFNLSYFLILKLGVYSSISSIQLLRAPPHFVRGVGPTLSATKV